ncbi:hypothetical protein GQ53DRAFT_753596 [Thozetella sp. PMI_491]|nr:hypothetical protein GQ53DRAFT_753596 [Thozetella sp. PMI_491]
MAAFKVGIIIGSTRVVRVGPQITTWVLDVIKAHLAAQPGSPDITFDLIDLAALNLPLFDEPGVPSRITSAEGYVHEHTRAWSRRIASLDGFVFVASQHNWGIPAGLKNAIDYLFNEWKGKPAAIVTYGGHGGNKCGEQLGVVLGGGIDMRVAGQPLNLAFAGREMLVSATKGKELGLDARPEAESAPWADRKGDVVALWEQLLKLLTEPASA